MLRVESIDEDHTELVVFQGYHEFDAAACAVGPAEPQLAKRLGELSAMVRYEGLSPESTKFVGHAAVAVVTGLEQLSRQDTPSGVLARCVLADAEVVVPSPETASDAEFVWPAEDVIAHIQALLAGPHSRQFSDPTASVVYDHEADFFNDLRRVPIQIT